MQIIKTSEIPPPKTTRGKPSTIPTLLAQIPAGQTGELTHTDKQYKIATVRSYIEKQHKKRKLLNYTLQQRTDSKTKTKTLYITREADQPCKESVKSAK